MEDRGGLRVAAYVVAGVLVLVAGARYLEGQEARPSEPAPEIALDGVEGEERGGEGASSDLYVHVAGAVRREGLHRVPTGSRVGAAVERAGGLQPKADLAGVNLAAELQDGQQVVVPRRGATSPTQSTATGSGSSAASASSASSPSGAAGAPISLASATSDQLDAGVEGIGPTLAARIVEFRDQNGGFQSIEQLREVDGIGEARFAALREAVSP
jgi:competence protein ComEA